MIFVLFVCGLLAMAAGVLAGVLASFFLRLPIQAVWKDALLGLFGFQVFYATTFVSPLDSLLIRNFIDPNTVGLAVAALCAIVRQVLRFRTARSDRTANSAV
jgi:hypothetical protein